MSIPLGGFHFSVGLQTQGANAALATLRGELSRTATAARAAFAAINTTVNTQSAVAGINQVTQAQQQATRATQAQAAAINQVTAAQTAATKAAQAQTTAARAAAAATVQQAGARAPRAAAAGAAQAAGAPTRISITTEGGEKATGTLRELNALAAQLNANSAITFKLSTADAAKNVASLKQQIDAVRTGQSATFVLKGDGTAAIKTIKEVEANLRAATARGATIRINVQPPSNAAMQGLQQVLQGGLRGALAGSGAGGGLILGAGVGLGASAALAAAVATQKVTEAVIGGTQAGLAYNAMLQQTTQAFILFTGGAETAQQSLAQLRRNADITPFNTAEVIKSGQAFAQVSAGNIAFMQRELALAEQLAATNPEQGLEGATRALRELQGGQVESIANRFNVPRETIQHLKDLGLAGEELEAAVVKAAGGSEALVRAYGESFTGRLSTAQSAMAEFGRIATQPVFDVLSKSLEGFNRDIENNRAEYERFAALVGQGAGEVVRAIGQVVLIAAEAAKGIVYLATETKLFVDQVKAAAQGLPTPGRGNQGAVPPLTNEQQANQNASNIALANRTAHQRDLAQQKKATEDVENAQKRVALMVAFTTEQYEKQLRPLEEQLRVVNDLIRVNDARLRRDDEETRKAQAPVGDRANAAGQMVLLTHEQDLMEIRHRRAEMAETIKAAESEMNDRAREGAIRAAQAELKALQDVIAARQASRRAAIDALREQQQAAKDLRDVELQGLQDRIRAQQEARQLAIEAAREEITARQQVRQAAIEAAREQQQAAQDTRARVLEGIQDEIRARRDAYNLQKDAATELARIAEETYTRQARSAERANRAEQERFRLRVQGLQDQDGELRKQEQLPTPAERELKAMEAARSLQQSARSLAEAQRSVATARTGAERRAALEQLKSLQEQQAYDRSHQALQERAEAEREARDQAAQQRQEAIAALQRQASDADRKYQAERQAAEDKHQQQVEAQAATQRQADAAEKALEREEDARVRGTEVANREADRQEQAALRAQEKADREATRQEQLQLAQLEKADREATRAEAAQVRSQEEANRKADRAAQLEIANLERADREKTRGEQAQIREREASIEAAQLRLRDEQNARQVTADAARLARTEEAFALETKILAIREDILKKEDVGRAAAAAAAKVRDEDEGKRLAAIAADIAARIDGIKSLEQAALAPYLEIQKSLDIQKQLRDLITDATQRLIDHDNLYLGQLKDEATAMGEQALKLQQMAADAEKIRAALEAGSKYEFKNQFTDPGFNRPAPVLAPDPLGTKGPEGKGTLGDDPFGVSKWIEWLKSGVVLQTVTGAIKGVYDAAVAAWDAFFRADTTAQAASAAWSEGNAAATETPWEVASPSKRMARLADDIALGFTLQMAVHAQEIAESLESPFIAFTDAYLPAFFERLVGAADSTAGTWLDAWNAHHDELVGSLESPWIEFQEQYIPAFWDRLRDEADQSAGTWVDAWNAHQREVVDSLESPFIEFEDVYLPAFADKLTVRATESATAFTTGWTTYDWATPIQAGVNSVLSVLTNSQASFAAAGQSAATSWCNGWQQAMANCNCTTCQGREGGGGGGGKGGKQIPSAPGGPIRPPPAGIPAPSSGRPANAVGAVLPSSAFDLVGSAATRSPLGAASAASLGGTGPVTVQITNQINANGITDPATFAQQITDKTVAAVIDVFDQVQQRAPSPVERYLPGGR